MAKNPLITNEVRQVITETYLKHSDWIAKEIRDGVEARLHEQNPRSKRGWPGLSSIQKELSKIRMLENQRPTELKELDNRWSIGTLKNFPIPAGALSKVLGVKWLRRDGAVPLTIREAMWIGRLYCLPMETKDISFLSAQYALRERVSELTGKPVDTFEIDDLVLQNPLGAYLFTSFDVIPYEQKATQALVAEIEALVGVPPAEPKLEGTALLAYITCLNNWLEKNPPKNMLPQEQAQEEILELREKAIAVAKVWDVGSVSSVSLLEIRTRIGAEIGNWEKQNRPSSND